MTTLATVGSGAAVLYGIFSTYHKVKRLERQEERQEEQLRLVEQRLETKVKEIKEDVAALSKDVKEDIAALSKDVKEDIAALSKDVKENQSAFLTKMEQKVSWNSMYHTLAMFALAKFIFIDAGKKSG